MSISEAVVSAACAACGNTLINQVAIESGGRGLGVDGVLPLAIDDVTARRRLMHLCYPTRVPIGKRKCYAAAEMHLTYYPYVVFSAAVPEAPLDVDAAGSAAILGWSDLAHSDGSGLLGEQKPTYAVPAWRGAKALLETEHLAVPPLYGAGHAVAYQPAYLAGASSIAADGGIEQYVGAGRAGLHTASAESARELGLQEPVAPQDLAYSIILAPMYTGTAEIDDTQYRFWIDGTTGIATVEQPGSWLAIPLLLMLVPLIAVGMFAILAALFVFGVVSGWAIAEPFD
ncbi:MAG: hypothetical protein ACT4PP_05115 [Sporichthyaceae bacterium]